MVYNKKHLSSYIFEGSGDQVSVRGMNEEDKNVAKIAEKLEAYSMVDHFNYGRWPAMKK